MSCVSIYSAVDYHILNNILNHSVVALKAQRSAQELPQVDKSSLTSCLVSGGEEMVISGSNFFPESKVIFLEKGPGKFGYTAVQHGSTKVIPITNINTMK